MFIITDSKNPKKHGILWDAKAKQPLIKFSNGKATTDDKAIADKLQKLGFKVVDDKVNDDKSEGNTPTNTTNNQE